MTTAGQLGEAHQLAQRAIYLGTAGRIHVARYRWPMVWQADILREWNQLDAARALAEEAISLCQQNGSFVLSMYLVCAYATFCTYLSVRGELDAHAMPSSKLNV